MSDFLKTMAEHSAERAAQAKVPDGSSVQAAVPLQLSQFDVIAEIKSHSPSEGELAGEDLDRTTQARQYVSGGAAAISVLTEPSRFAGSLEHLKEVAAAVPDTPVMRKDFLVEPVQVVEARAAGASGVLLIATMLDDAKLNDMLDCAFDHQLFVLLETFDEDDLRRTSSFLERPKYQDLAESGHLLVGVNTRNLRTLEVDSNRLAALAPALPAARCVAESGLHSAQDAADVAQLGYHLALVGSALMRSDDPAALIAEMRAAGSARIAA
ncbi:MAG: indole-3-glycerol phosphate synthase TrpC [Woeseiaceae bacterium]